MGFLTDVWRLLKFLESIGLTGVLVTISPLLFIAFFQYYKGRSLARFTVVPPGQVWFVTLRAEYDFLANKLYDEIEHKSAAEAFAIVWFSRHIVLVFIRRALVGVVISGGLLLGSVSFFVNAMKISLRREKWLIQLDCQEVDAALGNFDTFVLVWIVGCVVGIIYEAIDRRTTAVLIQRRQDRTDTVIT